MLFFNRKTHDKTQPFPPYQSQKMEQKHKECLKFTMALRKNIKFPRLEPTLESDDDAG